MRSFYRWLQSSVPLTVIYVGIFLAHAIVIIAVVLFFPYVASAEKGPRDGNRRQIDAPVTYPPRPLQGRLARLRLAYPR
jgi:ABC-type nitrate/sulfonate/bicarbonate transport system permease component